MHGQTKLESFIETAIDVGELNLKAVKSGRRSHYLRNFAGRPKISKLMRQVGSFCLGSTCGVYHKTPGRCFQGVPKRALAIKLPPFAVALREKVTATRAIPAATAGIGRAIVCLKGDFTVKQNSASFARFFWIALISITLPLTQAFAGMVSTESVVSDMSAERTRIADWMNRTEVKNKLVQWGVNATEAGTRIAALSDSEVRQVASRMDQLPAGGDGIYLGLGALILIGIILILLYR